MTPKARMRLYAVLFIMSGFALATGLTLYALKDNISYFRTPSDIVSGTYPEKNTDRGLRLGGLVVKGSLQREVLESGQESLTFEVTDLSQSVRVHYQGIVPDLFREGQGVIAEGKMSADGVFMAQTLLAKHDEKYMPPEIAKTLKKPAAATH